MCSIDFVPIGDHYAQNGASPGHNLYNSGQYCNTTG